MPRHSGRLPGPDHRAISGRIPRREFLVAGAATLTGLASWTGAQERGDMYGLIGKMTTTPGKRDEFITILSEGVGGMPGCLSYIIAKDTTNPDAIWITEVWDSKASHEASLTLPSVKDAIAKGRALIAGFSDRVETTPVGGHGLVGPGR
jgi:quinol monooxygenase YgiN